jgi:hypothetical protein
VAELNKMIDMKDWVQDRADTLASMEYDQDFYDLTPIQQDIIYNKSTDDYKDHMADMIDNARDRLLM